MNDYLQYLLEVSIVFGILYTLYYILYRKLTFHTLNRYLLLLIIPISFILPFLKFEVNPSVIGNFTVPTFNKFVANTSNIVSNTNFENSYQSSNYYIYFYGIGVLFFACRLILNALKLLNLKQNSSHQSKNGMSIITANIHSTFSCFNWIFVPKSSSTNEDSIIEHEKAHTLLGHTYDLILTEIVIALLWFNPFVFFFRKSIKSVHEFQADQYVLKDKMILKSDYLALMLHKLEKKSLVGIYSYFNCLTIKNRVKMITTNKSNKSHFIKYIFIIPVIALLTMGFTEENNSSSILNFEREDSNTTIVNQKKDDSNWSILKSDKDKRKVSLLPIPGGEIYIEINFGKKIINPKIKKEQTHNGAYLLTDEGTEVITTMDGVIIKQETDNKWGNFIAIEHADGYSTFYAHLKGFKLKKGTKVRQGDVIGYVGHTGVSKRSQLYYEIRLNNKPVHPFPNKIKLLNNESLIYLNY